MKVKLNNVRCAFLAVFTPKESKNDDGKVIHKFGGQLIIDPTKHGAEIKALNEVMVAVANEKWGAKGAAILAELKKKNRVCYYTDPYTDDTGNIREGFEDMHRVSASSSRRPIVVDRDRSVLTQADGKPYSGCYINASIDVWAMDNTKGKRVCAEIKGVQFVRDGDAFGGGAPATPEEFDELGVDQEAADLPV